MQILFPILLALGAGLCVAIQSPTNAMLARSTNSLWLAASISFVGGTVVVLAIWALIDRTPVSAMRQAPAWTWLGGLYGAFFVAAIAFAAPRLGLAVTLTAVIAAQLVTAVIIDHYGLLALPKTELSLTKVAGVVLVIGGALLVRR